MSEPKHIKARYRRFDDGTYAIVALLPESPSLATMPRYTLTEGPEFEALMQRAREAVETPAYKNAMLKGDILRDILTYFGETP